jgi:hypothetical protein
MQGNLPAPSPALFEQVNTETVLTSVGCALGDAKGYPSAKPDPF